jgi:hypothetical protein
MQCLPPDTRILGSTAKTFKAPRMDCCLDRLVKRVEIPISLKEPIRVRGLYSHRGRNHQLLRIARKLNDLLQCETLVEADQHWAFPTYVDLLRLMWKAVDLYAMPLDDAPAATRMSVQREDFCHQSQRCLHSSRGSRDRARPEYERLTTYVLTRPNVRKRKALENGEAVRAPAAPPSAPAPRNTDLRRSKRN